MYIKYGFAVLAVGVTSVLVMAGNDPACEWNKTQKDCGDSQDYDCPDCNLNTAPGCANWGPDKKYTNATDIFTLTQVGAGSGEFRPQTGVASKPKSCWVERPCEGTEKVRFSCISTGCRDDGPTGTVFCDECSAGAIVPNAGTFNVHDVLPCDTDMDEDE